MCLSRHNYVFLKKNIYAFHLLCHNYYLYLLSLIFTVIIISKLKLEDCYVLMQNIKMDNIYKIVVGIVEKYFA